MPTVDIHDETFVAVPPAALRERIVGGAVTSAWFPGLVTSVFMDRDDKGVRWSISGEVDGSLEVWLEQVPRGTVVHWFVRGEPAGDRPQAGSKVTSRYVQTLNAEMFMLKDQAEGSAIAQ